VRILYPSNPPENDFPSGAISNVKEFEILPCVTQVPVSLGGFPLVEPENIS
jgi:hypothetical protein